MFDSETMVNRLARIEINPKKMAGKPVIKGTRIPVDAILKRLSEGCSIQDVLDDYPRLTRQDIQAALAYASKLVRNEEIIPVIREHHAISR